MTYSLQATGAAFPCQLLAASTNAIILCAMQPGEGGPFRCGSVPVLLCLLKLQHGRFNVAVGPPNHQWVVRGSDEFFYPIVPAIWSVRGCQDLGNATINVRAAVPRRGLLSIPIDAQCPTNATARVGSRDLPIILTVSADHHATSQRKLFAQITGQRFGIDPSKLTVTVGGSLCLVLNLTIPNAQVGKR